ncbi:hypothetical protein F4703DRAFT_1881190 [Phycomyces blakesleeanus]
MASRLPFEMLFQIADLLETKDKLSCALTCKNWRYPFQKSIWRNVRVETLLQFKAICNIIENPKRIPTPLGQSVLTLQISPNVSIPRIHQDVFFKFLPNLKHLDLGRTRCEDIHKEMAKCNGTWKSLESLTIQITYNEIAKSTGKFIELLTNCHKLQKLRIFKQGIYQPVVFNAKDFDNLHQKLQQLTSFDACISLSNDSETEQHIRLGTVPVLALTTLELRMCEWNVLWAYHFAHKYPNLRFIRWNTINAQYYRISPNRTQRSPHILDFNTGVLQHLETFEFTTSDVLEMEHHAFWGFLCSLRIPIKNLKYETKSDKVNILFFKTIIKQFMEFFYETLETLSVKGDIFYRSMLNSRLEIPSYCPLLVDFEINSCNVAIELRSLLDNCVALKRLRFSNGAFVLYSEPMIIRHTDLKNHQHGLQTLELNQVSASFDMVNYISSRCKSLKYMSLESTCISGFFSGKDMSMFLEMSHISFKILHLANVRFTAFNVDKNENTNVNLLVLSQLDNSLSSYKKNENTDSKYTLVERRFQHLAWFHIFTDHDDDMSYKKGLNKIPEQEANTISEYFRYTDPKRHTEKFKAGILSNKYDVIEEFKSDLCKGYIELRCKHIEKYTT